MGAPVGRTPRLGGDGLALLAVGPEHADEMAGVLSDPALYAVIGGTPPSVDELRDRYRRQAAGSSDPDEEWHTWVVRDEVSGRLVGFVQATVTAGGSTAELAWVVGTPWQGRGLARRAGGLVLAELRHKGVDAVIAHVAPGHEPSERVARALGLRPTEVLVDGEVRWEGRLDASGGPPSGAD